MDKYLILGSEGFIGSHAVTYFKKEIGVSVYGIDIKENGSQEYIYFKVDPNFTDYKKIFKLNFDVIINCAGSGNVPLSMQEPLKDFFFNCQETAKILDAIRLSGYVTKYVHISSAAVYGNSISMPVSESDLLQPVSSYGWNKIIAENLCQQYFSIYQIPIAIIRPFSVFGEGLKKQLFWDWFIKISKNTSPIELFGSGSESRDFIYVRDLIFAIDCIIKRSPFRCNIYNAASGKEMRIVDVAHLFFQEFNRPDYYFNGIVRQGDPLNWQSNISELQSLGFTNKYDFKSGLNELVKWLKKIQNENS